MAIRTFLSTPDQSVKVMLWNVADGTVWNGSAAVAYVAADIATYAVAVAASASHSPLYEYMIPPLLPNGKWREQFRFLAGATLATTDDSQPGATFKWDGSTADDGTPGTADWYYSDQDAFEAFNGIASTSIEDDLENAGEGDDGTLQAAGERGDNYIDRRLKSFGWTVPLTGLDAFTTALLTDLSNRACRWQLAESKNYGLFAGALSAEQAIAQGNADKKDVDDELERIEEVPGILTADGSPSDEFADGAIPAPVAQGATVDPFGNSICVEPGRYWPCGWGQL